MDIYSMFVALVMGACDVIGVLPAIIVFGVLLGLLPFVIGFAVLQVLLLTLRRAVWRLRGHLRDTTNKYFQRLKFKGLTEAACRAAVWCSLVVWVGVLTAFAVTFWKETLALTISALIVFTIAGWRAKGPRSTLPRFVRSFYEPTAALTVPTVVMKSSDIIMKWMLDGLGILSKFAA